MPAGLQKNQCQNHTPNQLSESPCEGTPLPQDAPVWTLDEAQITPKLFQTLGDPFLSKEKRQNG